MADRAELIERLEALQGPDRDVDKAIVAMFGKETEQGLPFCAGYIGIACFTASIDATLELVKRVKPGWQVNLSWFGHTLAEASIGTREGAAASKAEGPAIAILIALLRSLEAKEGER